MAQWFVNGQKESIEAAFLEQARPLWIRECSHLGRILLAGQDHLHLRLSSMAEHVPSLNDHLTMPMIRWAKCPRIVGIFLNDDKRVTS